MKNMIILSFAECDWPETSLWHGFDDTVLWPGQCFMTRTVFSIESGLKQRCHRSRKWSEKWSEKWPFSWIFHEFHEYFRKWPLLLRSGIPGGGTRCTTTVRSVSTTHYPGYHYTGHTAVVHAASGVQHCLRGSPRVRQASFGFNIPATVPARWGFGRYKPRITSFGGFFGVK